MSNYAWESPAIAQNLSAWISGMTTTTPDRNNPFCDIRESCDIRTLANQPTLKRWAPPLWCAHLNPGSEQLSMLPKLEPFPVFPVTFPVTIKLAFFPLQICVLVLISIINKIKNPGLAGDRFWHPKVGLF